MQGSGQAGIDRFPRPLQNPLGRGCAKTKNKNHEVQRGKEALPYKEGSKNEECLVQLLVIQESTPLLRGDTKVFTAQGSRPAPI